jgi:pantoate--beta-alanine ligase
MLEASRRWRVEGHTIGLVPTMGALHAGHMSLVERACRDNSKVVVSIFVNPLQFGPGEDLERYPASPDRDLQLLRQAGVSGVYSPAARVMYPPGATTRVRVGAVAEPLEGLARQGHFEGVATVVTKLFDAVEPDRAYFGQKDAQQAAVVKRLARDLDTGVEICVCPTVREPDGVALSSRNAYLNPEERKAAVCLSAALKLATRTYQAGERDAGRLRLAILGILEAELLARVDYAEIVDPKTFTAPGTLAVLAVWIGKTRLIDNHDLAQPFPG